MLRNALVRHEDISGAIAKDDGKALYAIDAAVHSDSEEWNFSAFFHDRDEAKSAADLLARSFGCVFPVVKAINQSSGVLTVEMGRLRDAHKAGKLGVNVVAGISEELASRGLSHYPKSLPLNQWESARIYRNGTPIAKIVHAVLEVGVDSDVVLRDSIGNDYGDTLRKIRELVCD